MGVRRGGELAGSDLTDGLLGHAEHPLDLELLFDLGESGLRAFQGDVVFDLGGLIDVSHFREKFVLKILDFCEVFLLFCCFP